MARRKMEQRMEFWWRSLEVGSMTPGLSPDLRVHVAHARYSNLYGALSHTLPPGHNGASRTHLTHKMAL